MNLAAYRLNHMFVTLVMGWLALMVVAIVFAVAVNAYTKYDDARRANKSKKDDEVE